MPVRAAGQYQGDQGEDGPTVVKEASVENPGLVPNRPTVRPTRIDTPPKIDGRLDDEAWRSAALITKFVQQAPLDGAPATEETEVYVAYDSENIYFGFYAHYEDPSIMRANRVDRDRAASDDLMTVYFDTFMDQQRGYDFDVNGYGVQGDGIISAGSRRGGPIPHADRSWNTLFETGGQIVEDGYTAEMAIPFKSLRYPKRARDEEAPVGVPDRSRGQDEGSGEPGLGVDVSRRVELLLADGRSGGHGQSVHQPETSRFSLRSRRSSTAPWTRRFRGSPTRPPIRMPV